MLQRRTGQPSSAAQAGPRRRTSGGGGLSYIKASDLTSEPRRADILMAKGQLDKWNNPSVTMQVRYDGKLWLLQISDNSEKNPNYDNLLDILGEDESQWAGSAITIHSEQDPFTYKQYIRVGEVQEEAVKPPKKR